MELGQDVEIFPVPPHPWAGCRVKIYAAEDVEDFESLKDVSNAEDVTRKRLTHACSSLNLYYM